MSKLNHFNESGGAHMVDISEKSETVRIAVASAHIRMQPETAAVIRNGTAQKGDVLGVAQVAGIMAAKNTQQLIPMCHPLMLTGTDIAFDVQQNGVAITATVKTTGKTGVEMEALTAASVAALTIYDMVKAIDRGMIIESVRVESKTGGASGDWQHEPNDTAMCEGDSCGVDIGSDAPEIDVRSLASLRVAGNPTGNPESGSES